MGHTGESLRWYIYTTERQLTLKKAWNYTHYSRLGISQRNRSYRFMYLPFALEARLVRYPEYPSLFDFGASEDWASSGHAEWRCWVFATTCIVFATKDESDTLLNYLINVVTESRDTQVRFKRNKNGLAIWVNRSNWHCATYDYEAARAGDRACSPGKAPCLDLTSKSRRQALNL